MVVILVHHDCKPGMADKAIARLDANGTRMAAIPGFLFRYRLRSESRPLRLSTVTGWESEEHYQAWLAARKPSSDNPAFAGEPPYDAVTTEVLHGERTH